MKLDVTVATRIAAGILEARGAPGPAAARVVSSLLSADRRRVATHGFSLLPLYAQLIADGVIDPAAEPESETLSDSLARVDGRRAFGQLTGEHAVDLGIRQARHHGIAAVGIVDGTHLGRLGEWAERACEQGMVFLAFTNTAGGALNVAGATGSERVLSTNPVAIGVPSFAALEHDVIVDFASSQVSGSRIRELANAGGRVDPDWIVASSGIDSDDPEEFLSGRAALRPLGGKSAGHKGFGLMVASEMLAALAGGLMAGERDQAGFSNGALFCLLDVTRFTDAEEWGARARSFSEYLVAHGCRLPGSKVRANAGEVDPGAAQQSGDSLDLADHTVAGMLALAQELGVDTQGVKAPSASAIVTKTW